MRTHGAMALALGLCVLAGCGGGTKTVTQSGTALPPTGTAGSVVHRNPTGLKECRLLRTEKRCTFSSEITVHALRHEALHLKQLTAKLVGVRAAPGAKGEDLIITLNVKNDTSSPQQFGRVGVAPTILDASGEFREETGSAEREDPNSFVSQGEPIQPNASKTADVIFEVPRSVARDVMKQIQGGLFIGNFMTNFYKSFPARGLGLISIATKPIPGTPPSAGS